MLQIVVPVILGVDRQFHRAVDLRDLDGVDVTGFNGYTVVTKIRRTENQLGGSRIRLVLHGPNNSSGSLSAVYIGEAATTGYAWSFASSATQVTFNGASSVTLNAKDRVTSDQITYDFNPARAHIVAMNVSASSLRRLTAPKGDRAIVSYYKAATTEAGTTVKSSGYTTQADTSYCLEVIHASRTEA
jgi:hypothetical protein